MNDNCNHYQRPVFILAECCKKWFKCHICHNENSDHEMDRYKINKVKCSSCLTIQNVSDRCENIDCKYSKQFTSYFCSLCKLYSDDPNKHIYHCNKCGICRLGKLDDYFHCEKCNACLNINMKDDHQCFPDKYDKECPVCQCNLFNSQTPVINFKNCVHAMCNECYQQYIKNEFVCPLCKKSLHDMTKLWENIDKLVPTLIMPEEFAQTTADVLCFDCLGKSIGAKYHFQYHKCVHCGSYNTTVTKRYNFPNFGRLTE